MVVHMWPKHGLKNSIFSVKIIRREMAASEHPWAHHIMNFTSAIRDTQNYIFSSRNVSDSKEKTEVILKHLYSVSTGKALNPFLQALLKTFIFTGPTCLLFIMPILFSNSRTINYRYISFCHFWFSNDHKTDLHPREIVDKK